LFTGSVGRGGKGLEFIRQLSHQKETDDFRQDQVQ